MIFLMNVQISKPESLLKYRIQYDHMICRFYEDFYEDFILHIICYVIHQRATEHRENSESCLLQEMALSGVA